MAFPASQQLLVSGLQSAIANANQIKQLSTVIKAQSEAGDIERKQLIGLMRLLSRAITEWAGVRALSGVSQYAKDQYANAGLDIVAEFVAMETEAIALRDWIASNFPKDIGSGAWLVEFYDTSGAATSLVFTTVELVGFRSRVDSLLATIG
jgi:hypothetical protein